MESHAALHAETARWCQRAQGAIENPPADCVECLKFVREGILLRRRWDQGPPDAEPRRQLLRLLPAVGSIAQNRLSASSIAPDDEADGPIELVESQIDEDDRYLASLLREQERSPESAAFAIECFRDDLHWLGTEVAVLDGGQCVDFLGRIILEQEALDREIDLWDAALERPSEVQSAETAELHKAAHRLRTTALTRQIKALADQGEPQEVSGCYAMWQAASRLTTRWDESEESVRDEREPSQLIGRL